MKKLTQIEISDISANNHNYVNSQISFQGPKTLADEPPPPPLHSSSSKDYVNQAVINENQHKHKLSVSQHKHRKSHKSSSQNDKRYHSGMCV